MDRFKAKLVNSLILMLMLKKLLHKL